MKLTIRKVRNIFAKHPQLRLGLFLGLSLFALTMSGGAASALRDAAWVNTHVEWGNKADGSAKPVVVDWENNCTQEFQYNKTHMSDNTEAQRRGIVNASAYIQDIWLSRRNDARNINNNPVNPGQAVNMQINDLVFLCAIVTMNASGFGIAQDHKVTNSRYPNDRKPVPDSPAAQYKINQASRYESNSYIYRAWIGSGGGSISNSPVGDKLGYKRDGNSRYWSGAVVPFTYHVPANATPGSTINVVLSIEYATIQTYHAYGSSGTSRCTLHNGDGATIKYNQFSRCDRRTASYRFRFTVAGTPNPSAIEPRSQVDKQVMTYPDTATFKHDAVVTNSGPGNVRWTVRRTINGAPAGANQTGTLNFNAATTYPLRTNTYAATPADIGKEACEELTLDNPSSQVEINNNPDEACVKIAAEPYLKVYGGDISAGNGLANASNACTNNNDAAVVSWNLGASTYNGAGTQYATYALDKIMEFSTAQGNAGGAPRPSGLAFSNTNVTAGTYGGNYGSLPCIPDYYARKPAGTANLGGRTLSSLNSGAFAHSGELDLTSGNTINPGNRIQLFVDGDVYITDDIKYAGNWSLGTMPLFELVARGNIYIDPGVGQLDGLYIAQKRTDGTKGNIYTCTTSANPYLSEHADTELYADCSNKLTINGAFVANQVQFLRTEGTISDSTGDNTTTATSGAAEQFNFNPTLWIAQPPNSNPSGSAGKYDAITSLPPIL